jgi:hypothetical protein
MTVHRFDEWQQETQKDPAMFKHAMCERHLPAIDEGVAAACHATALHDAPALVLQYKWLPCAAATSWVPSADAATERQ